MIGYTKILHTAFALTTKNPMFWLFGLVLYGGFNLYLINFFALLDQQEWRNWFGGPESYVVILASAASLLVLTVIKIAFIILAHGELHSQKDNECDLCTRATTRNFPYLDWFKSIVLSSVITIFLTSVIAMTASTVITNYVYSNVHTVIINVLLVGMVTCIIGTWNVFTNFFVVLHGMTFVNASKAALNLLVLRPRVVAEFVLLLSVLYSITVFVGNSFISVWHHGVRGFDFDIVRLISLVLFFVWFAFNNAYFNVSFLVFFDTLVAAIKQDKPALHGQPQPNVVN